VNESVLRETPTWHRQVRNKFGPDGKRKIASTGRKLGRLDTKALHDLALDVNASAQEIKTKYKLLVKQNHPDANGGDRSSEDRLRQIIQAYKHLKQAGLC
jgi:DnaJ-domain-containing protein 1